MKTKINAREIKYKLNIMIVVWEWDNLILKQIVTIDSKWTKYLRMKLKRNKLKNSTQNQY